MCLGPIGAEQPGKKCSEVQDLGIFTYFTILLCAMFAFKEHY